ncbi:hypothetical protein BDY24DRAFT_390104 [Mrakia frigida]|uniref:RNA recognition motif domain-containing protein n=1 Tax=Mrakia frigida TaxID=29902 RepID=UPI003FCBFF7C
MTDRSGYSQGFGFIEFERAEDAEQAMKALNGTMIRNKSLLIIPDHRALSSSALSLPLPAPGPPPPSFRYDQARSTRYDSYRPSSMEVAGRSAYNHQVSPTREDPSSNVSGPSTSGVLFSPSTASLDTLSTLTAALHANPSSL